MRTYIVDTYAWIAYLEGKEEFKLEIEANQLETPSIVLAEVSRILKKRGVSEEEFSKIIDFIKKRSLILELSGDQSIRAGKIAVDESLYLIDAIVYSFVEEEKYLLTGDKHFKNKKWTKHIRHIGKE
jgi:predicted nucleic acid-binding protein